MSDKDSLKMFRALTDRMDESGKYIADPLCRELWFDQIDDMRYTMEQ